MNMVTHLRMRRLVSAYVDGELDDETARRVADHLRHCWRCSGDAELDEMVKRSLGNLAGRGDTMAALRLRRFIARLSQ